ncbi:MAG: hypothetical protein FRX48_06029 [Lasallia pustulata]|uniref:SWR1-complex protein 3 domain-containing protein n=1 Tax=Lasallia pustulata TaxID=136370 RepID=A0A5M8PM38_9LECA|nr:MAG: hypothetical protein FRX48_06029 [Lasallia pustulata]
MSEPRKPSTRNRGEPPKKRPSTPPPKAPPPKKRAASPAPKPPPPEPVEQGLPTKLRDGQPLPTLPEQQGEEALLKGYQGIAESGVLASSIERSRQKWLTQGIFERYWTKPSKKKNQAEVQNPPKDTMVKIGICSMTIEPHVFETTLYTVKEPQLTFLPPLGQPMAPPVQQHAYPYHNPAYPPPPTYAQGQFQTSRQFPPPHQTVVQPQQPPPHGSFPQHQGVPPTPLSSGQASSPPGVVSGPQNQAAKPNPDPVIQMLATKAATDHDLKALMRVVASGKASQTQLRIFQGHIDELNGILQSRNKPQPPSFQHAPTPRDAPHEAPGQSSGPAQAAPAPASAPAPTCGHTPNPATTPGSILGAPLNAPIKTEPLSQYYSQAPPPIKAKGPIPYKTDIKAIVFEFTGGTGDRFLFPKNSILEYLTGGTQVIASFLIFRKGDTSTYGSYKKTTDYYQPVTIRLSTHNPRTLEPLTRVVAPADDVRKRMDDIMDKMTPADNVYLAIRLPRSDGDTDPQEEDLSETLERESVRPTYSPPNTLVPLKHRAKQPKAKSINVPVVNG